MLAELGAADGLVEVGYRDGVRTYLELRAAPLAERPGEPALDTGSVVLVTGGARGITARVALALAERHRPTLVLVGRTSDEPESAETAALPGLAELRSAAIEDRRREGRPLTPALIEKDCLRILRGREVRDNLQRLRETGARVEYLICDVGEEAAFGALIDSVYEQHGRIDGVIHGAGVIEDKLICDKQPDSLGRVLAAKAGAAQTLAARLRPATLRFLVLFSSVSGRFGNRGQADYAAASEVLGKLAHDLDRRWSARVVAVDWGPWRSTGMVSAALEEEFAKRGVALIGLEQGSRLLLEELERGRRGEAEIVIGAADGLAGTAAGALREEPGADRTRLSELPLLAAAEPIGGEGDDHGAGPLLRARYHLDLERDLYLGDHRIDGRPVLPFAVAMELMAEAGVAASGDRLAGLREIRLLDGVALEQDRPVTLDVQVSRPGAAGVEVTIGPSGGGRAHYRADVALRGAGAGTTVKWPEPAALAAPRPLSISVEEAYRELLFHGPLFQGIVAIDCLEEGGTSAVLRGSEPGRCVAGAEGRHWLLDPVLLDSALQVQVLWARLQWDVTLLPAQIGAYVRRGRRRSGRACPPRAARAGREQRAAVPRRPLVLRCGRASPGASSRTSSGSARRRSTGWRERSRERRHDTARGVAIIGMACLFPGAPDLDAYWRNILAKVDATSDPPPEAWDPDVYYDPEFTDVDRTYCKRGGYLGRLAAFEPLAHGVPPVAVGGEPDQWLALQVAHDALADAGMDGAARRDPCPHGDRARQGDLPERRQRDRRPARARGRPDDRAAAPAGPRDTPRRNWSCCARSCSGSSRRSAPRRSRA